MDLTDSTALITGASGGIGEQFAVELAGRVSSLVLVARRAERLETLRTRLLEHHPRLSVDVLTADLSQPGAAGVVTEHLTQAGLTVDVLINNAGVGSHGKVVDEDPVAAAAQVQLNCVTLIELTGRLLPAMVAAHRGVVLNVASTAAFQPIPTMAVYAASKAFVLSYTEALAAESHGTGVRVMALCPGATDTEFFARTGENFLTRRQSVESVVATALAALDGSAPTVIPGLANRFQTLGSRFVPRRLMPRLAQISVAPRK